MGTIVCGLSHEQSDAIENSFSVLYACIEAARLHLIKEQEPKVAFGLGNALRDFETNLQAIWSGPAHYRPHHHNAQAAQEGGAE